MPLNIHEQQQRIDDEIRASLKPGVDAARIAFDEIAAVVATLPDGAIKSDAFELVAVGRRYADRINPPAPVSDAGE